MSWDPMWFPWDSHDLPMFFSQLPPFCAIKMAGWTHRLKPPGFSAKVKACSSARRWEVLPAVGWYVIPGGFSWVNFAEWLKDVKMPFSIGKTPAFLRGKPSFHDVIFYVPSGKSTCWPWIYHPFLEETHLSQPRWLPGSMFIYWRVNNIND